MARLALEHANRAVSRLSLMAFFPSDPDFRGALAWALMQLVETEAQMDWLTERSLNLYSRWPGICELRALYCSRFRPKDGTEAYSETYPGGFPHESPAKTFPATPRGAPMTKDADLEGKLQNLRRSKTL